LNTDQKGIYLGSFLAEDHLLVIYKQGYYELSTTEMTQRFDTDTLLHIEKFDSQKIITAIYLDNEKLQFNAKRFRIETTTVNNKFQFIREFEGNHIVVVTTDPDPVALIKSGKGAQLKETRIKVADLVEVMGWRAVGSKFTDYNKSTTISWFDDEPSATQAALF
jgi:topoisomerase-4 subunit A